MNYHPETVKLDEIGKRISFVKAPFADCENPATTDALSASSQAAFSEYLTNAAKTGKINTFIALRVPSAQSISHEIWGGYGQADILLKECDRLLTINPSAEVTITFITDVPENAPENKDQIYEDFKIFRSWYER